ncbi:MAG: PadR family transcriptional regulator [Acidimicrobiales bacterium]|nr:PadR family transcriptional regulator [Acidimicrobiales bacterium]
MSLREALLGLLASGPKSGYDLKREFDRSAAHAWNANSSQIYPLLRDMQADGLIVEISQPEDSRRNKYELTERGRQELSDWLCSPVEPRTRRDPLLLRMFFLDFLTPAQQHHQLVQFVEEQDRFLQMCNRYRKAGANLNNIEWRLASMEIAVAATQAQKDFVERLILDLAGRYPEVEARERARRVVSG